MATPVDTFGDKNPSKIAPIKATLGELPAREHELTTMKQRRKLLERIWKTNLSYDEMWRLSVF